MKIIKNYVWDGDDPVIHFCKIGNLIVLAALVALLIAGLLTCRS